MSGAGISGNVAPDAAQRDFHVSGIGVACAHRCAGGAADIYIDRPNDDHPLLLHDHPPILASKFGIYGAENIIMKCKAFVKTEAGGFRLLCGEQERTQICFVTKKS